MCITSSVSGEGKSITLLNLAISFAQAGHKVLLVDADMRRPALARQGRTRKDMVRKAVNQLELTGAKILGYVLNGIDDSKSKSYGYYGYGYAYAHSQNQE
ncbi:MAG: AAA family ATPase [Oscillospiraceae bacterium]|nr:AAA family ATPase [Oscillospiraceae bacterium]